MESVRPLLFGLSLVTSLISTVAAKEELLQGQISAVGSDKITVVISERRHDIKVAADTQITLDGNPVKLSQLVSGHKFSAIVERSGETLVAKTITAMSPK
jgi:hypothetical protein